MDHLNEFVDGIPGTVYLVDEDHKASGVLHDKKRAELVLNPAPSNDVNDPLNWSKGRKFACGLSAMIYVFTLGFGSSTYYPLYSAFQERGITLSGLSEGTGYLFGLYGWGGLIIVPLGAVFGTKPIMLISLAVAAGVCFWTPSIASDSEWIASRCVYGIFGAPVESIAEIIITQVFFTHQRGPWIGAYSFVVFGCSFFAPILSGWVYEGTGMHGTMYFTAAVVLAGLVFLVFFCEESNYVRKSTIHPSVTDNAVVKVPSGSAEEKTDVSADVVSAELDYSRQLVGQPYGYLRRMTIFRAIYATPKQWLIMSTRPVLLIFQFPCIFWAGLQYGWALSLYTIMIDTLAAVLGAPPYNFSVGVQGVTYVAPLLGVALGGFTTGYLSNTIQIAAARRAGGIREPESRLILFGVSMILTPAFLILWGVGAQHQIHWFGLVFAMFVSGVTNGITATLALNYVLDIYRGLATEATIATIIVRNSLSFGMGYAITPWLELGYQNAFIIAAFAGMGLIATFIPMMIYGKQVRKLGRSAYAAYAADSLHAH